MFKTISKIFGTDKVIDAGIKGIDAMILTPEEKVKYHLEFLTHYEPFKIAQRYLAFAFSGVFLMIYLNAVFLWNLGIFTDDLERSGFLMATAYELAEWNTKMLGAIVAIIIGWYFAGGVLNKFGKGA